MRLRYYKAVKDEDQSEIQEVSNEAESLLKGDHPLFRQQIQEKEVKDFLLALNKARYNEKHGTSWLFLIITVSICGVIGALLRIPIYFGVPIGLIAGIALYFGFLMHYNFFYKTVITFSTLPPVPLVS